MGGRVCCLFLYLQSAAFSWCRASEEWQDVTFIHLLLAHTMRPRAPPPALSPRGRRAPPAPPRRHLAPAATAAPQLGPAAHTGTKRENRKKIYNSKVAGFLSGKQAGVEWDSSVGRRERGVPLSLLGDSPAWGVAWARCLLLRSVCGEKQPFSTRPGANGPCSPVHGSSTPLAPSRCSPGIIRGRSKEGMQQTLVPSP